MVQTKGTNHTKMGDVNKNAKKLTKKNYFQKDQNSYYTILRGEARASTS